MSDQPLPRHRGAPRPGIRCRHGWHNLDLFPLGLPNSPNMHVTACRRCGYIPGQPEANLYRHDVLDILTPDQRRQCGLPPRSTR